MITDELLERGLAAVGDGYDVPPHAIDDILDQLRPAEAVEADTADIVTHRRWWPPSGRAWMLSSAAALIVLVIVAFAVGGAGNGGNPSGGLAAGGKSASSSGAGATNEVGAPPASAPMPVPAVPGGTSSTVAGLAQTGTVTFDAQHQAAGSRTPGGVSNAPVDSLTKIVQTGELDLQVDKIKVDDAVTALTSYARGVGGFVASSESSAGDGDPSASITLRVPNDSFGGLVGRAKQLGKPLALQTKTADVTAQYVDLQARIHALGETKTTYLRILSKATTIAQILSVQQQVNDIQTQIEQLQGQLKVLTDQTTYATLTVNIDQKAKVHPAAVVHHQSGLSKAVHRSVSRFVHGIEAIIGVIGPIVLVLLLIGLGWLLAKVGYRIVRRQMV